jgi:hypothetical protein
MIAFLAKLIFGHVRRHRLEALLCLVGVALGVAVTVAVDAAVTACVQSFAGAVGALAERSTHSVFAGAGTLTDEQYIALLRRDLPFPLSPMIDRRLAIGDTAVRLIGVDVFAERRMRSLTQVQSSLDDDAFRRFMTEPGAVVAPLGGLAAVGGHHDGDAIRAPQLVQQVEDHPAGLGVEVAGRLVGQQQGRAVDDRPCQSHALLLPAG